MDHERFDNLTRTLATHTSRRQVLKLLGGSIAGAVFAAFGGSTAQAARPNQRTLCINVCKSVAARFRGECMSACMPCPFEESSFCVVSTGDDFAAVCCPGQGCSASDDPPTAVCVDIP